MMAISCYDGTGLTLRSPLLRYPESSVLRAVSSSFLSLLLLVTLMWGGCISCPQFFMVPKAEKSCCDEAGKCKRQSERLLSKRSVSGCRLSRHQSVARIIRLPLRPFRPSPRSACRSRSSLADFSIGSYLPLEHSPPDLQVLNATFLI